MHFKAFVFMRLLLSRKRLTSMITDSIGFSAPSVTMRRLPSSVVVTAISAPAAAARTPC